MVSHHPVKFCWPQGSRLVEKWNDILKLPPYITFFLIIPCESKLTELLSVTTPSALQNFFDSVGILLSYARLNFRKKLYFSILCRLAARWPINLST
jgi:hypothetical protein